MLINSPSTEPTAIVPHQREGSAQTGFVLRYASIGNPGRGLVFPCDAQGVPPLDTLGERARNAYFAARAMVGRDYLWPVVERVAFV